MFLRMFLYTFPVSSINILGLLPELGKHVQLSVSFTDFVLEMSWVLNREKIMKREKERNIRD